MFFCLLQCFFFIFSDNFLLAFARQLETKCNELYPGLLRDHIHIRETGRYNQQAKPIAKIRPSAIFFFIMRFSPLKLSYTFLYYICREKYLVLYNTCFFVFCNAFISGRYNQQANGHSVLLEIGSDLNTQEEANYALECFAQVVYGAPRSCR